MKKTTTTSKGTFEKTLNLDEKNLLFGMYAVFIGGGNVFPVNKAVELFGSKAVQYLRDTADTLKYHPFVHMGKGEYIDFTGFGRVVTYHNSDLYEA